MSVLYLNVTILNIFIAFHYLKHIYILATLFKNQKCLRFVAGKSISGRCNNNNFQMALRASLFWNFSREQTQKKKREDPVFSKGLWIP